MEFYTGNYQHFIENTQDLSIELTYSRKAGNHDQCKTCNVQNTNLDCEYGGYSWFTTISSISVSNVKWKLEKYHAITTLIHEEKRRKRWINMLFFEAEVHEARVMFMSVVSVLFIEQFDKEQQCATWLSRRINHIGKVKWVKFSDVGWMFTFIPFHVVSGHVPGMQVHPSQGFTNSFNRILVYKCTLVGLYFGNVTQKHDFYPMMYLDRGPISGTSDSYE